MNRGIRSVLFALLLGSVARGEELIPGICWFDPPPHLERYNERNDPGDDPFSMRSKAIVFQSGNQPANLNSLAFSIRLVGATIGEGKVVTINPISDEQLKLTMASVVNVRATNSQKVEDVTLAGQKALKVHASFSEVYWVRVRPNQVLEIHLHAPSESLLVGVRGWLSSLKIRVSDKPNPRPPAKLAKVEMQLGFSQDEIRKRCGEPLSVHGPNETYITEKYLIYVCLDSAVNMISYHKVSDPQKTAAATSRKEFEDQILPFPKVEAEKILQRQTGDGKLNWSPAGENRWKRSDGAMAALTSKGLTVATADMWPKIRLKE